MLTGCVSLTYWINGKALSAMIPAQYYVVFRKNEKKFVKGDLPGRMAKH